MQPRGRYLQPQRKLVQDRPELRAMRRTTSPSGHPHLVFDRMYVVPQDYAKQTL